MRDSIEFFTPGKPQGKARARTVRVNGITRSFTPDKTVMYENLIKMCFLEEYGQAGFLFGENIPVSMHITAFFGIPASTSRKKAACMARNELLPTKKPDADNIAKVVADALNGVAYKDDTQVTDLHVEKRYSAAKEGLFIRLEKLDL